MREKRPSLATREVGKDEDSAESLKRKLEAIELEIKAFEVTIRKLEQTADELIERQHYDAANIEKRKVGNSNYTLTLSVSVKWLSSYKLKKIYTKSNKVRFEVRIS